MKEVSVSDAQALINRIFDGNCVDLEAAGRGWRLCGFFEYLTLYSIEGVSIIEAIFSRVASEGRSAGKAWVRFIGADDAGHPVERGGVSASVEFGLNELRAEYDEFIERAFTGANGTVARFRYELGRGCWVLGDDECVLVGHVEFEYVGFFLKGNVSPDLKEISFLLSFEEMRRDWINNSGGNPLLLKYIDRLGGIYLCG